MILASTFFVGLYVLQLHISQVIFFCGLMYMFYEPVKKFAEQNTQIQKGIAAAERMYEVLEIKSDIADAPDAIPLETFKESIVLEDVWFKYDDEWILKGLSFTIKKGETVAIVGPTGAGRRCAWTFSKVLSRGSCVIAWGEYSLSGGRRQGASFGEKNGEGLALSVESFQPTVIA